jgi:cytochrome c biogenesis protein CcmG/thiol:disulfide interchange protein DsbE
MRILFLFLGILFAVLSHAADEGKAAPELQAKLLRGKNFSLSEAKGQVVIVHFWATWCAACKIEMPVLDDYYKKHRAEGLRLVALSKDSPKDETKARDMMKNYSFDGGMAKEASYNAYGRIWKLPLTFVVDRKGILQKDGWNLDHELTLGDFEKVVTPLLKANH